MKALLAIIFAVAILAPRPVLADEIAKTANQEAVLTALDAYTTYRNQVTDPHNVEHNALVRPFVKSAVGTSVYFATSALSVNLFARLLNHSVGRNAARQYLVANAAFEVSLISLNTTSLSHIGTSEQAWATHERTGH